MKPLMLTKTEVYDLLTILRSRIETTKDNIAIRERWEDIFGVYKRGRAMTLDSRLQRVSLEHEMERHKHVLKKLEEMKE